MPPSPSARVVREPIVFKLLPQDDPKQRCPDLAKARRVLNWGPQVNLADGLARTYEYFRPQVAAARKQDS